MKRISLFALTALVGAILACGGGDDEGGGEVSTDGASADGGSATPDNSGGMKASDLPAVPMVEPWASMNLPVQNGQVVVADANVLLIAYDTGSIPDYTASYSGAITRAGWAQKQDYSSPDFTAILYSKATDEMGFAVGQEENIYFVYFEDLDGTPDESEFKAAQAGRRPGLRGRVGARRSTGNTGGGKSGKQRLDGGGGGGGGGSTGKTGKVGGGGRR
jgi:hypothetical protein